MSGGQLRDRITFERFTQISDGAGGFIEDWTTLFSCRGAFMPERSRERLEAGRLESAVAGTLKVRSSAALRDVTAGDRAMVNGEPYAIKAVTNPDRRGKYLDMTVERGAGGQ